MERIKPTVVVLGLAALLALGLACASESTTSTPTPTTGTPSPGPDRPVTPTVDVPSGPGSAQCQAYLELSAIAAANDQHIVATAYECGNLHVDSTGQTPASVDAPHGQPIDLHWPAARTPVAIEARLYVGRGLAGSFMRWPEELPTNATPIATALLSPSTSVRYDHGQQAGDYSLVIKAEWAAAVVFYALDLLVTPDQSTATPRAVSLAELLNAPAEFDAMTVEVEGFYFHGFETIVLAEGLGPSGLADGHLWPTGGKVWVEGSGLPRDIYDRLSRQEMMGPVERYGRLRIVGRFESGGGYGHTGAFDVQIVPTSVTLLPLTP